jgi:ankyrin repeat protein
MRDWTLHRLVRAGDLRQVQELLAAANADGDVNSFDSTGRTPLMHAVVSSLAGVEMVRTLLAHGARVDQVRDRQEVGQRSVLSLALSAGDLEKISVLLESGADLHYTRPHGYDALIDAVYSLGILQDGRSLELLAFLVSRGVKLSSVTSYGESALRVLSRFGRFDGVKLLLEAGADEEQLQWTPLIRAVALGSIDDVKSLIASGVDLEARDCWSRTAWLVAIQTGDLAKAILLRESGADENARGRCGKPPLFYAIENLHVAMLQWLIETGVGIDQTDEFGTLPLAEASKTGDPRIVDLLLTAGAKVDESNHGQTALSYAGSRDVAERLLEAGADPRFLSAEGRRMLLGLEADSDEALLDISASEYRSGRARRFGRQNPERIVEPFWLGMIRSGISGYQAAQLFHDEAETRDGPVWCAQRFGQSITFLPDGRIVQIGGEHEDFYDPDFCIYNDVFVHEPGGAIQIFCYPESVFPPTDFHTATLIGDQIFLIGSLGYQGSRQFGTTPVARLDTNTFQIERLLTSGDMPGWISRHRAILLTADEIAVEGGIILKQSGDDELHLENDRRFVLDTRRCVWRAV